MSDTSYIGSEVIAPESFLEPRKYKVTYQCDRCGHTWSRTYKMIPNADPPCPTMECRVEARVAEELKAQRNFQSIVENGPPGHIGNNPQVKAIDRTAEIVMHDHGLTNLRDNIREGESMAPKLPPHQQQRADAMFDRSHTSNAVQKRLNLIGERAKAGMFRKTAVDPHAVLGHKPGDPIFRHVGTEKL